MKNFARRAKPFIKAIAKRLAWGTHLCALDAPSLSLESQPSGNEGLPTFAARPRALSPGCRQ